MASVKLKTLLVVVILAALICSRPRTADASIDGIIVTGSVWAPAGLGLLVFMGADVHYAMQSSWLPRGWAIAQIVWGTLHVGAALSLVAIGAAGSRNSRDAKDRFDAGAFYWNGLGVGVLGIWYLTHGIISLYRYRRPKREAERAPGYLPVVAYAPLPGGGYGSLMWRFE